MKQKSLVLIVVGALGIVGLIVIVVIFIRNGEKEGKDLSYKDSKKVDVIVPERDSASGEFPAILPTECTTKPSPSLAVVEPTTIPELSSNPSVSLQKSSRNNSSSTSVSPSGNSSISSSTTSTVTNNAPSNLTNSSTPSLLPAGQFTDSTINRSLSSTTPKPTGTTYTLILPSSLVDSSKKGESVFQSLIRSYGWKYLLDPNDPSIKNFANAFASKTPSEKKASFCSSFNDTVDEISRVILALLKVGGFDEIISQLDSEVSQAYKALEKLGYSDGVEVPRFPVYLLGTNVPWYKALYSSGADFTFLFKDPHKELTQVAMLVNYFVKYLHIDQSIVASKRTELFAKINDPLISITFIRAFFNNAGAKDALAVVTETSLELFALFNEFNIKEPEKQKMGISLSMKPEDILNVLKAKFFLPPQIRGAQLVLDGQPRGLQNGRAICYGLALLQCLANFLPLWKLTAMNGVSFDSSSQSSLTSYKISKVFEEVGKNSPDALDVSPMIDINSWGDSTSLIWKLSDNFVTENRLKIHDFVGIFQVTQTTSTTPVFTPTCSICKKATTSIPCCFSFYSKAALIMIHCTRLFPNPSIQVLDIERGKYITYSLYAFTFGGNGHQIAFVKRANGKWYKCNDSIITEVEEDKVPIFSASREIDSEHPQLVFYVLSADGHH